MFNIYVVAPFTERNINQCCDFYRFQVFVKLERPALEEREAKLRNEMILAREDFIESISKYSESQNKSFLMEQLKMYEEKAQEAVEGNLMLTIADGIDPFPAQTEKWTILQAIFFASTVCTTIGYGNIVPETFEGRLFCIFFALIGIPFTLTVIADYGKLDWS